MSKILQSLGSLSFRYNSSLDVNAARVSPRRGYGKLGNDGAYEPVAPSVVLRVPRKLRILKLRSRGSGGNGKVQMESTSGRQVGEETSRTLMGRVRMAYEKMMLKAASKTGELRVVPIAKASRAPPVLSSVVSTYPVWSAFGSRVGTKISDLDPGFKLTGAEKKYLEHLKRTASSRGF